MEMAVLLIASMKLDGIVRVLFLISVLLDVVTDLEEVQNFAMMDRRMPSDAIALVADL